MTDTDGVAGGAGPLSSYGGYDRDGDGLDDGLDDTLAFFTNYGSLIDLAAPGVDIYSTWKDAGYNKISGTSMSAPHVTGAVALYIAAYGRASDSAGVAAIRDALVSAGEPQTSWRPGDTGDPDALPEPLVDAGSL
jgi:subtilisin family serine protease